MQSQSRFGQRSTLGVAPGPQSRAPGLGGRARQRLCQPCVVGGAMRAGNRVNQFDVQLGHVGRLRRTLKLAEPIDKLRERLAAGRRLRVAERLDRRRAEW